MQLLKKERDDMWDSIADIVKENVELKDIIAGFTININNRSSSAVQTEQVAVEECTQQTEYGASELTDMEAELEKANVELEEAKKFCVKTVDVSHAVDFDLTLKNCISETLSYTILNLSTQFTR